MLLRTLSIAALLAMPAAAEQSQTAPVVLDLFTSEGCSSCPPADALLAKLHRSPGVDGIELIVLSEHVDYWNRLGWADPFSSNQFSQRQKWYSSNWPTRMYTPQLVVDGAIEVLGNDPLAVRRSIRVASLAKKAALTLVSKLRDGRHIDIEVEIVGIPANTGPKFELLGAVIEDDISTNVTRGENKGRVLSHVAVVRKLESLGQFSSREPGPVTISGSLRVERDWKIGNIRTVVFVQDRESRRIVGAAVALPAREPVTAD